MKNHNKLKDALINAQHFVILDLVLLVLQLLTIFVHAAKLNKWVDVETRLSAWKYVAKNSIVVSIIVLQLVILGIVTSVMKSLSKLVFVNGNWWGRYLAIMNMVKEANILVIKCVEKYWAVEITTVLGFVIQVIAILAQWVQMLLSFAPAEKFQFLT